MKSFEIKFDLRLTNLLSLFLWLFQFFKITIIINNDDLLVCGNKSINNGNFTWFEVNNGVLSNISKFTKRYRCNVILFITVNMIRLYQICTIYLKGSNFLLLTILIAKALRQNLQLHDATDKILHKISSHNFFLLCISMIILSILFIIY